MKERISPLGVDFRKDAVCRHVHASMAGKAEPLEEKNPRVGGVTPPHLLLPLSSAAGAAVNPRRRLALRRSVAAALGCSQQGLQRDIPAADAASGHCRVHQAAAACGYQGAAGDANKIEAPDRLAWQVEPWAK